MMSNYYRAALNAGRCSREKGVRLSVRPSVCSSVCLSVKQKQVDCDKTEETSVQIRVRKE